MTSSSQRSHALIAKKACTRCSTQKRRCDRALPGCGLCTRLRQTCKYDIRAGPSSGPTPSPSPRPEAILSSGVFTTSYLKDAIIQRLEAGSLTPEDTLSAYSRAIEPWFPIIPISDLKSQLPPVWEETPLSLALLCLSIILLTTIPPPTPEDENHPSEFKSLYFYTKSCITSTETLGINSVPVVQARILVTLFEISHGLYPAAYISIGATFRAADILETRLAIEFTASFTSEGSDGTPKQDNIILIWAGVAILNRYITMESGPNPSLTSLRTKFLDDLLKPSVCPTHQRNQDKTSPMFRHAHLFEASSLLDKIHTTLNSPTSEYAFSMEELVLIVQTLTNLQFLLVEEIGEGIPLYSGGLCLCKIALLVAFENGTKVPPVAGLTDGCNATATQFIIPLLSTIVDSIEPFTTDPHSIDFNVLPPFIGFLMYKAALIVTEKIWVDGDSNEGLRRLRILRSFLGILGERWLGGERYLRLLNEDTTPRILKALE